MKSDRPEECKKCDKPLCIRYKKISGRTITEMQLCEDCPQLKQSLCGNDRSDKKTYTFIENYCCVGCHTSLEQIKCGLPLGCPLCYTVFEGALNDILKEKERIAPLTHSVPFFGKRAPDVEKALKSSKILELGQALNTAIAKENYEEAAWLRDQIKEMTEPNHE